MKTATKIHKTIEVAIVCPHCGAENFFNNHDHSDLLKNGGVVTCDMFDCDKQFHVPPISKA